MMNDCVTVWDNCLHLIRQNVNAQSFKTWFEPVKPVQIDKSILTIQVPNKFFYEWLEEHYVGLLKQAVRSELGEKGQLHYQIMREGGGSNGNGTLANDTQTPGSVAMEGIKNPFVIPGIRKVKVNHQLNPKYLFGNFIEGDCNRLARSAGEAIANNPGGTAFNPLFIFGNVGLGKTHLAQAVGNAIVRDRPEKTVLYVSIEKFTNQIIQAIKNNAVNDFVNFYQLVDVLIVDDIQFLANRKKTQEIFFHVFNQLHQSGKQIIITSDCPPKDLPGMEERLISRFKWGLSADLNPPEFETRMAILQAKMQAEQIDIPNDVLEFICFNIKENIRELEGVLISLTAQASLNRRQIDIDLAREVIQKFVTNTNKEVTIEKIKNIVAEHHGIPVEKLKSKSRKREIVMARQVCMYLSKEMTRQPLKSIGSHFGGRDHSTVIYSCKSVQNLIETDTEFRHAMSHLEKKIAMSVNG